MKKFIALIILTVLFNPSFANNEEGNIDTDLTKNQMDKTDGINLEKKNNVEYFDNLRKTDSDSKNILGIGQIKKDSNSTDAEICSIAANKGDGQSGGTGLCGVPSDTSEEESNNESNDKPS